MKAIKTILLLALCQVTMAQVPTLSVHQTDGKQQLEVSQLDIAVEVVGNIATTTFDVVFYNPFNTALEGELSMPLKAGQEICRTNNALWHYDAEDRMYCYTTREQ